MTDIILHHYWTSPYSETVRLALGAKKLAWRSVEQPVIMPKPHLIPLTGGYRRIPVMQIGADIYCDTQLILRELDRRFAPKLEQNPLDWALRAWVERSFFAASVGVIFGAIGEHVPSEFIKDREALSGRPFDMNAMKAAAPMLAGQWRAQAEWVDAQLADGRAFLFGEQIGLSDVAAVMPFWWTKAALGAGADELTDGLANANAWASRVQAIGHGQFTPMNPEEAVEIARAASPEPARPSSNDAQGLAPGRKAIAMADDYGRDPIAGEIVFIDAQEIALGRTAPETGDVVVHLPRAGYWARPA